MKFVLGNLRLGDRLLGKVEEVLSDSEILINFAGDLVRVHNETRKQFLVGERVMVQVRALEPLHFQVLPDRREQRRRGHLDVNI